MVQTRQRQPDAFTLIELVLIVAMLAILAALVVPRVSSASGLARAAALRQELKTLRTQIMVYRVQHLGLAPGYPQGDPQAAPTLEAFAAQLTQYTNAQGRTAAGRNAEFCFGPYLLKLPVNPVNNSAEIRFVAADAPFPQEPAGGAGWVYQPHTGAVAANVAGRDPEGVAFFDY